MRYKILIPWGFCSYILYKNKIKNYEDVKKNEKKSRLSMYLFGLSTLGELSNNFTKQSNFVEEIVEVQGEIIQSDMNDIQNKTEVKFNICKSDTDDTKKRKALKCNKCQSDKNDNTEDKKNEKTTVVGLMSVFN